MTLRGVSPVETTDPAITPILSEAAAATPLPSPRGVALEVMRLTRDDRATVSQIAEVLSTDPAIASRLIDVANGASLAIRRPVVSVRDAVIVLGFGAVRQLALGFSLIADHSRGDCERFPYPEFWSHSLLLALAAEAVVRRVGQAAAEEMFACGLLAQVGRLAFATLYPVAYSDMVEAVNDEVDERLRSRERDQFGLDNVELSMIMLREWGLPEVFVRAVGVLATERRSAIAESPRVAAVMEATRLAWLLTQFIRADPERRTTLTIALLEQAERTGIDTETTAQLIAELVKRWTDWARRVCLPVDVNGRPAEELKGHA